MVNPVNNNIPPEYQSPSARAAKVENNEKFSLGTSSEDQQNRNGVIYERSDKSDKKANSAPLSSDSAGNSDKKADTFEGSLDKAAKERAQNEAMDTAFQESVKELFTGIGNFFGKLWNNIRQIFGNLWDSKPIGEGVQSIRPDSKSANDLVNKELLNNPLTNDALSNDAITNDDASLNDSPDDSPKSDVSNSPSYSSIDALEDIRDKQIRKALTDGDRDGFRELISDSGKKIPARNTSMLTTYDSKGKLVNIDPSDENKILHGNRRSQEL